MSAKKTAVEAEVMADVAPFVAAGVALLLVFLGIYYFGPGLLTSAWDSLKARFGSIFSSGGTSIPPWGSGATGGSGGGGGGGGGGGF